MLDLAFNPPYLFFSLSPVVVAFLFLIVLIIYGPGKLPDVMRALGEGVRQFKRSASGEHDEGKPPTPPTPGE